MTTMKTTLSKLVTFGSYRMQCCFAENLYSENPILTLLPSTESQISTVIAGVEIQLKRDGETARHTRNKAVEIALRTIHQALPESNIWILGCHAAWQDNSRIVEYKKLWKGLESGGIILPQGKRLEEIQLKSERGQRWFGGIEVRLDEISLIGTITDKEAQSLIVVFPSCGTPDLSKLIGAGWAALDKIGLAGWRDIAIEVCKSDGLLLRPFGGFDDVEVGTAIFAPASLAIKVYDAVIQVTTA